MNGKVSGGSLMNYSNNHYAIYYGTQQASECFAEENFQIKISL